MKYVIMKTNAAISIGIKPIGHNRKDGDIVVSEKEVMASSFVSGTLEERVLELQGEIYDEGQMLQIIKKGGWSHE